MGERSLDDDGVDLPLGIAPRVDSVSRGYFAPLWAAALLTSASNSARICCRRSHDGLAKTSSSVPPDKDLTDLLLSMPIAQYVPLFPKTEQRGKQTAGI